LWSIPVEGGFAQGEPDILHRNIGRALILGVTDPGGYYYHQQVGPVDVFDAQLEPGVSRTLTPISAAYSGSNISSVWSPDGSQIAFASRRGPVGFTRGWTALVIRDVKTGVLRELMPAMNMFLLRAWSPDGRSILVQGENALGRTGAHAIDTRTGSVSPVVLNGPGQNDIRRPDWRPDGAVVYINNRTRKLLVREVRTGREKVLLDLEKEGLKVTAHVFGRGYRLSPDGQSLAYTVNGRENNKLTASLWIKPLDGGEAREVAKAPAGELLLFQDWTPDGTTLLFTTWIPEPRQPVSLFRVSVNGGEPESLRLIREGLRDVSVSPDGTRITFTAGWPRAEIWGLENLLTKEQLDGGAGR
jgi:Tol biopolymer transport system component